MQQNVGFAGLLQRGPEGGDEVVGQLADEPDGVGDQSLVAAFERDQARCGVQRGEEAVLDELLRARERLQDGRLARVRIPHQSRAELSLSALPPRGLGPHDALQLAPKFGDAGADESAVGLQLGLAGAPQPDPAADPREVDPHALEPGQQVLELGQLDLQAGLVGAGAGGKNVQDQFGAVHHPNLAQRLQVLALRGGQLVVKDDQIGFAFLHQLGQFAGLALAEVVAGLGSIEALHQLADDQSPGGVGQAGELGEVLRGLPGPVPALRGPHEDRPLDGGAHVQKLGRNGGYLLLRCHSARRRRSSASQPVSPGS